MQFFPTQWWNLSLEHPASNMWERAPAATPHWIIGSLLVLTFLTFAHRHSASGWCLIGHAVIAFGQLFWVPDVVKHAWQAGAFYSDVVILHAIWINALFAWLHWLNLTRCGKIPEAPPPKNETGSV